MNVQDDPNLVQGENTGEGEEQLEPVEVETEEESAGDEMQGQGGDAQAAQATPVRAEPGKPASPPAAKAAPQQEDTLDFERSTITIVVKLYAQVGEPHQDGRRVSISVHNGAGRPVTSWYRAAELSEKSELDKLQGGIARTVHRFRSGELSRRKLEVYEREQQRKAGKASSPRPSATSNAARTPGASTSTPTDTEDTGSQIMKGNETEGDASAAQPVAPQPLTSDAQHPTPPAPVQRAPGKGSKQKDLVQTSLF